MHFLSTSRGSTVYANAFAQSNVECPTEVAEWTYWDTSANAWKVGGGNLEIISKGTSS